MAALPGPRKAALRNLWRSQRFGLCGNLDDAFILMDACDILETAGFRFFEAGSGDEAQVLLEEHAESVILLFSDVEMPRGPERVQVGAPRR